MDEEMTEDRRARIRALNDALRQSLAGGEVLLTTGVSALEPQTQAQVLAAVRAFATFSEENDPYGEHDFGAVEVAGSRFFFKIDYFDPDLRHHSADPADPAQTERVMTIMRAEEY